MSGMSTEPLPVPEPAVRPLTWRGGWRDGSLRILDQTRLPRHETEVEHTRAQGVVDDIRRLAVRGAPVIGVAGAYSLVLAARELIEAHPACTRPDFLGRLREAARVVGAARPTAVNLPAAVERSLAAAQACPGSPEQIADALLEAARRLDGYEREACAAIGRAGAAWLRGRQRFLTHCNAGALVTTGIGTALAPIYVLHAAGEPVHVWVGETRPLFQGLRLTAYELGKAGVAHAVVSDGTSAGLMRQGRVDAVIVGADRVCRNGDVVNKVGTYALAGAARRHGLPFVVAAPLSTLDGATPTGDEVPIEDRPGDLDLYLDPALRDSHGPVHAPAFDVTPAGLVSVLVTELGVLTEPSQDRLRDWFGLSRDLQRYGPAGR